MVEEARPYHNPVLLEESIDLLDIQRGGTYVDVTFGGGGHSAGILKKLHEGRLIAFDRDADAHQNVIEDKRLQLVRSDFQFIEKALGVLGVTQVQGILADLGISSHQVDTAERGFSFRFEAELDMRMDQAQEWNASDVVNDSKEDELYRIFRQYGEVKTLKRTVDGILRFRKQQPIRTTGDLLEAIREATPARKSKQYLSQVFQALRIEVNGEMDSLTALLKSGLELLAPGGKFVIISYHSLEDRMVKRFFRSGKLDGVVEKDFWGAPLTPFKVITRKAIAPSEEEILENPRARSARLRAAEKIGMDLSSASESQVE